MQRWLDHEHAWPREWRDALGISDEALLVTPGQLEQLHDELFALIARYRDIGQGDPAARDVSIWLMSHPKNNSHD